MLRFAIAYDGGASYCRNEGAVGKTVTLAGPKAYTVDEVIELCEKYAGADADVTQACPLSRWWLTHQQPSNPLTLQFV
jgi:hypothetical protein